MNTTAEVYLWGTRVGIIHQDLDKPYASYEYDADFLKSGIEISPIMMPLSNIVYEFPLLSGEPFFGMPGLVVDSLPDTFGNKVIAEIEIRNLKKSMKGKTIEEIELKKKLTLKNLAGRVLDLHQSGIMLQSQHR